MATAIAPLTTPSNGADEDHFSLVSQHIQYHPRNDASLLQLAQDAGLVRKALVAQALFYTKCVQYCASEVHSRFSADPESATTVTVIGAGLVGEDIVCSLLTNDVTIPRNVIVSTRRPDKLPHISRQGVTCIFDNRQAVKQASIVILSCLPAHMTQVASDIRGHLPSHCVIISCVAGMTVEKIAQLTKHPHVITLAVDRDVFDNLPESLQVQESRDLATSIGAVFAHPDIILRYSPAIDHDGIEQVRTTLNTVFESVNGKEPDSISQTVMFGLLGCSFETLRDRAQHTELPPEVLDELIEEDGSGAATSSSDEAVQYHKLSLASVMSLRKNFVETLTIPGADAGEQGRGGGLGGSGESISRASLSRGSLGRTSAAATPTTPTTPTKLNPDIHRELSQRSRGDSLHREMSQRSRTDSLHREGSQRSRADSTLAIYGEQSREEEISSGIDENISVLAIFDDIINPDSKT